MDDSTVWGVFNTAPGCPADLLSIHRTRKGAETRAAEENKQHLMQAEVAELDLEP